MDRKCFRERRKRAAIWIGEARYITDKTSNFSKFFREGTPEEKEKVFLEVAKKASEDQNKTMNQEQEKEFDEHYRDLELGRKFDHKEILKSFIRHAIQNAREEERQFILNILDGIDIADKEMGNDIGGTKAIRFVLKSRIIK